MKIKTVTTGPRDDAALDNSHRAGHNLSMQAIVIGFLLAPLILAASASEKWWTKPSVLEKTREQRQILVVVKEDPSLTLGNYSMTGTGTLRAPVDFTLKKILDFSALEKISPYFKKVTHQPEHERVYMKLEAYGYWVQMLIKYSVREEAGHKIFRWNIVWGGFEGMVGEVDLSTLKMDKTEAILQAQFSDKEIPLPNIFKSFILEMIVQHVAKSMRTYIEDEYQKGRK